MSNVLLPENQKRVLRMQRTRFLFIFAAVALLCAFLFYVALLPGYFALVVGDVKVKGETASASSTPPIAALRETMAAITQLHASIGATTTPSEILQVILAAKPAGVSLDTLSYASGKPGKIIVSGNAQRSDLIQTYRAALDSDARFDSVNIPVSALVGSGDGSFTMTLSGTF